MMKRLACIVLFGLFLGPAWAEHPIYSDATVYPDVTIDLTRKVDLKMLFDGGLRPKRTMGLETQSCDAEDVRAKILFPGNRVVSLLVMRATFDVDAHQNILSMDLEGPLQPVEPAVAQAEKCCELFALNKGNLAEIMAHQGPIDYHNGWGQEMDVSGNGAQFILRPMYLYGANMADLSFFYRATLPRRIDFSTVPIQPPIGYENVSMSPGPRHPSGLSPRAGYNRTRVVVGTIIFGCIALVVLVFAGGIAVVAYLVYRLGRSVVKRVRKKAPSS